MCEIARTLARRGIYTRDDGEYGWKARSDCEAAYAMAKKGRDSEKMCALAMQLSLDTTSGIPPRGCDLEGPRGRTLRRGSRAGGALTPSGPLRPQRRGTRGCSAAMVGHTAAAAFPSRPGCLGFESTHGPRSGSPMRS